MFIMTYLVLQLKGDKLIQTPIPPKHRLEKPTYLFYHPQALNYDCVGVEKIQIQPRSHSLLDKT